MADWYKDPKYTKQKPFRVSIFWTVLACLLFVIVLALKIGLLAWLVR
jgi:hypothetical protein